MKNMHGFLAVVIAAVIGAGHAAAQTQTKTVQMGSNCSVTVTTSVLTNGGAMAIGGSCSSIDPQVIIKALGGGMATASAVAEAQPATWLGLAADDLSEDVRAQLPLPDGAGLVVRHITAGGPAAQAGVQANDILVRLDDQLLVNAAQLRALLRGKKEGDKITLTFLRKGKEQKVTAKLVKKTLPPDEAGVAQVINLGNFDLDLNKLVNQAGVQGGPVVINKAFTTGGGTNLGAIVNVQAILSVVSNALQQATRELSAPK